jgi:glycosyltransferase involved in cell wall biosynthesis
MNNTVSIIAPIYNERENLEPFIAAVACVLDAEKENYEILLVDDGSTDGSASLVDDLSAKNPRVRVIHFRRNFGQTAAMAAGFDYAGGDILIPIDADLQNDPADIPAVLAKLREGFDVVSCWRQNRQDPWFTRRLPSQLANSLISRISGVHLHDYGCTLKGYRREVVKHIRLYGEMHRFIPIYASWAGAKVTEIPIRHHPRRSGVSKYGLSRVYKVVLDLLTVKMLGSYSTKPMYFFGGVGLIACAAGFFFALYTLSEKYFKGVKAHNNPLLLLAVFLFLLGVQFILMGLVAELVIRTWFESQDKPPYIVRNLCGFDTPATGSARNSRALGDSGKEERLSEQEH